MRLLLLALAPAQRLLSSVPLARRRVGYARGFLDGKFEYAEPDARWDELEVESVLELGAGRALWAREVSEYSARACSEGRRARPLRVVAADKTRPPAHEGVESVALDNTALGAFASEQPAAFDLVFASHALCTCRWLLAPQAFARAADGGDGGARTCGGLALTPAAVDAFVAAVLALLRPNGVAVFDQEGGWPFGLETMMRDAVRRRDAHLLVRRGPIGTNVDYVISRQALTDDVSSDPLQRVSRVADAFLVATPLLVASLHAPPDAEYAGALLATKRALPALLALRLAAPYFDVHTVADVRDRLSGRG